MQVDPRADGLVRRRLLLGAVPFLMAVSAALQACGGEESSPGPPGGEPEAAGTTAPREGPPAPAAGTALSAYDFAGGPDARVELPAGLGEASGLAVDDAGRVYVHGDEAAILFRLDSSSGSVEARFGAGRPVLRSDFEGVALAGGRVYLVDSRGRLVAVPPGGDGEVVPHRVFRTRLGEICEVEGLTRDPVWGTLLLACKSARDRRARGRLRLYHYSLGREALDGHPVVDMPLEELEALGLAPELHPSAVEIHPDTDSYLVVASRQELLVEVNRAGHPVAAVELPRGTLPQPEGVAVAPDGSLWIVSEGRGGPGVLLRWDRREGG